MTKFGISLLILTGLVSAIAFAVGHTGTGDKYLFYLHGKIIEDQGIPRPRSEKFGYYEYEKILEAFRSRGFVVRSEIRPQNTDALGYAQKVVGEVRRLLQAGVSPGRITVVGASKGGIIAMLASAMLQNRDLNFVFLASCHDVAFKELQARGMSVSGNIFSIYDAADTGAGSCRNFFKAARENNLGSVKEVVVRLGLGHGLLYRPYAEWVEPVVAWAEEAMKGKGQNE